jgi:hypothetical protein
MIRTKRLRDAKPGDTILTELGAIKRTAILIEATACVLDEYRDQRIAIGTIVSMPGYSNIGVGREVSVCIGLP